MAEFYHKLLKLGGCPPNQVAALQPAIRDYDCAAYLSDFTYLTQPYAGVCETLAELNRRGIKNAVLTNKPNAVACTLIDRFFGDAMELCVGQTPETISKPDPHSMDLCRCPGIPREQILYVGTPSGYGPACTAAAAAAWGYQTLEMLLPYHPEFIVRRPEQLLTIF
ncbi:MAG: HAD family hydrolase [Butyricicoccus sp.]